MPTNQFKMRLKIHKLRETDVFKTNIDKQIGQRLTLEINNSESGNNIKLRWKIFKDIIIKLAEALPNKVKTKNRRHGGMIRLMKKLERKNTVEGILK